LEQRKREVGFMSVYFLDVARKAWFFCRNELFFVSALEIVHVSHDGGGP